MSKGGRLRSSPRDPGLSCSALAALCPVVSPLLLFAVVGWVLSTQLAQAAREAAAHPLNFSVVLLGVGDCLLSLSVSVKVCFYQSNNQDVRVELNRSDFFNISTSSLHGWPGGTAQCTGGDWCPSFPTACLQSPRCQCPPHCGHVLQLPRWVLRLGPISLRPHHTPVAKSITTTGFCCIEICTKQLLL